MLRDEGAELKTALLVYFSSSEVRSRVGSRWIFAYWKIGLECELLRVERSLKKMWW